MPRWSASDTGRPPASGSVKSGARSPTRRLIGASGMRASTKLNAAPPAKSTSARASAVHAYQRRPSATASPAMVAAIANTATYPSGWLRIAGTRRAQAFLHRREVLELARVAGERLDLEVHDLADVHHHVRVLPLHDVDLPYLVRLELRHQLGEGEVIARERIDAVQRDAADDAVVAVRGAEVVRPPWVLADDHVGPVAPDLARHLEPQLARVLDLAVGIAEERDLLDAERARGVTLLLGPDLGQPRRGHRAVALAPVAAGDDDEGDGLALLDELRHRAARAELAVIGVGGDHQHAPDGIGHALRRLPSRVCR